MKTNSKNKKKKAFVFTVGRRKTAVARIRLYHGKGETLVNDQPIAKYFSGEITKTFYQQPFTLTETLGKYYATIKVVGSGQRAQLGAVVHGLARALDKDNQSFHSVLKKNKLLTRDPRAKERRKVGQMGKARKKKQSPKR
ncbi:30S ribosomal protein S9 [Candidatus Woesebacteria bacterium CG_4_10_14_0_2_um_filter_39_14]|uniref:Small ribosomal subunit protein uS9 n=3 Tax=Microgenomates group TaxID=1794810 RepID=A0A2M6YPN9_9BACT|nr:MAG: 30S ribosomal protein S9 [Candidatus Shapirobacteria bacterium CG07_land_8_20_14_0_80_39_12]PIZ49079.1 MAG: 30S ribosomal protein S9 [Candidatus Woesebacteria bacterium CG_4_10_14_0_2_um_filter_39_14]PJA49240.1 MAG: 30S ribosomal protein S9 [Candidatus Shapirobacteria bacterium CG_4_9_14_3_um_filter_39_13]